MCDAITYVITEKLLSVMLHYFVKIVSTNASDNVGDKFNGCKKLYIGI